MKVRIERTDLADAVRWVQSAVGPSVLLPALSGLRLDASDGALTIKGTDLDTAAIATIHAMVDEPGAVLAPRTFAAAVAKLPDRPVNLTASDDLEFSCGRVSSKLQTLALDDFPGIPDPDPTAAVALTADTLALVSSAFAPIASEMSKKDPAARALHGVHVDVADGTARFAVTDRYRLMVFEVDVADAVTFAGIVNPTLVKAAAGLDGGATLGIDDTRAAVTTPIRRLNGQLIDATFPNVMALMPTTHAGTCTVDRKELLTAVGRVQAVIDQTNVPVLVVISGRSIELRVNTQTSQMTDGLDVNTAQGDGIEIAFNPGFLVDALKAHKGDEVTFRYSTGLKPAVIAGDPGLRALLMPMRIT